ncbi:hypothetical protein ACLB1E_01960 [Escherichia coli]
MYHTVSPAGKIFLPGVPELRVERVARIMVQHDPVLVEMISIGTPVSCSIRLM